MLQSEFFKRLGVSLIILDRLLLSSEISPSAVKSLPGFGPLPFKLETGYLGVDEKDDVQLFYYFVPSEGDPQDDPLVLWLTGGPGCSALSGLVYEIGDRYFIILLSHFRIRKLEVQSTIYICYLNTATLHLLLRNLWQLRLSWRSIFHHAG